MNQNDRIGGGALPEVLARHAADGAFLWIVRDRGLGFPHLRLSDLCRIDERVEANIDGLRVSGEPGWEIAKAQFFEFGQAGETFAAAVLAFESSDPSKIQEVLALGMLKPENLRALASALGWIAPSVAIPHIKMLLNSTDPSLKRVGLAGAAILRRNPGPAMMEAFASDDLVTKARALRAAGEIGLMDLQNTIRANLKSRDPGCRYWAAWSTALLSGHADAIAQLQSFAENATPFSETAAQLVVRRLPIRDSRLWIKRLAKELGRLRVAIKAIGALGDPDLIPWLIEQIKQPALARVAGESLSLITGVDITYDKLEGEKPDGFEAGPNDDPSDENVEMDPDENLPWPDPSRVLSWWTRHKSSYSKDVRHILGKPIGKESLRDALMKGYQRQRAAAALELAIVNPGRPLFETRAPGFRQQRFF